MQYLNCRCTHMRQQAHMRILQQTRMQIRLLLVHVQTDGKHSTGIESLNQSIFVQDSSSRCVHDDDTGFHLLELCGRDDVPRPSLRCVSKAFHHSN